MNKYMGIKLIQAESQNLGDYNKFKGWVIPKDEDSLKEGYQVTYEDGYISWSPKKQFDDAHLQVKSNPHLKTDVSISKEMVENFIKDVETSTLGEKTTLVRVTLVNGFEIIESSACVDKENYSESLGSEICLSKIKDKIWMLLGFLLQTAVGGIK